MPPCSRLCELLKVRPRRGICLVWRQRCHGKSGPPAWTVTHNRRFERISGVCDPAPLPSPECGACCWMNRRVPTRSQAQDVSSWSWRLSMNRAVRVPGLQPVSRVPGPGIWHRRSRAVCWSEWNRHLSRNGSGHAAPSFGWNTSLQLRVTVPPCEGLLPEASHELPREFLSFACESQGRETRKPAARRASD